MSQNYCTIIYNGERLKGLADQPLIDFLDAQGKNYLMSVTTRRCRHCKVVMSAG